MSLGSSRQSLISWEFPSLSQGWKRQGEVMMINKNNYPSIYFANLSSQKFSSSRKSLLFFTATIKVSEPNILINKIFCEVRGET